MHKDIHVHIYETLVYIYTYIYMHYTYGPFFISIIYFNEFFSNIYNPILSYPIVSCILLLENVQW